MRNDKLEELYESLLTEFNYTPGKSYPQNNSQNQPQNQPKFPRLPPKHRTNKASNEWYYTDDDNQIVTDNNQNPIVILKKDLHKLNPDVYIIPKDLVNSQTNARYEWMQVGELFPELYHDGDVKPQGRFSKYINRIFERGSKGWLYLDDNKKLIRLNFNDFGPRVNKGEMNKYSQIRHHEYTNNQWVPLISYLKKPNPEDAYRSKFLLKDLYKVEKRKKKGKTP